ncbi:MAG: hypothetical protein K2H29_02275 [Oscillospiraceae bacterium]|nr:hypothetical protein [Oscillospiraceae bacterium]
MNKKQNPENSEISDQQADEIVALLDALAESGSQHINLNIGKETKIRTINSTDCSGTPGACAIPTPEAIDKDEDEEEF